MAISAKASADGTELCIGIDGRFDFSSHQEFRKAYEEVSKKPDQYIIDMNSTTYLDSSALGMLLLLREHAGGDNAKIEVVGCKPEIKKILAIANFQKLFDIK